MIYTWVIGSYDPKTERGKNVVTHADAGIGYFTLNKDRLKGQSIIVGFKWASHTEPVPHHLTLATPVQIDKLESLWRKRNGLEKEVKSIKQEVSNLFHSTN